MPPRNSYFRFVSSQKRVGTERTESAFICKAAPPFGHRVFPSDGLFTRETITGLSVSLTYTLLLYTRRGLFSDRVIHKIEEFYSSFSFSTIVPDCFSTVPSVCFYYDCYYYLCSISLFENRYGNDKCICRASFLWWIDVNFLLPWIKFNIRKLVLTF